LIDICCDLVGLIDLGYWPEISLDSYINPLECKGNYSATSNNMKLVHWPLTDVL